MWILELLLSTIGCDPKIGKGKGGKGYREEGREGEERRERREGERKKKRREEGKKE